jgi:hypothetical protein
MKPATRSMLIVIGWSAGMAAHYANRSDAQWAAKLPVACVFFSFAGAVLWAIQRLSKKTMAWFVEGIALPFLAGCLIYGLIAVRNALRG